MKLIVLAAFVLCAWQTAAGYTCPAGYDFDCGNGYCVDTYQVCDGNNDCYNDADEEDDCDTPRSTDTFGYCPIHFDWDCGDGYCMRNGVVCDGIANCYNGDDELYCGYPIVPTENPGFCPPGYDYNCGDGYCVKSEEVCNGNEDCYNDADEEGCVNIPLAVGLAVAGFVVFVVLPLIIIPIICCCCLGVCASAFTTPYRTRFVTHTVPSDPKVTVVNSSNTTNMESPPYHVYPNNYQPAPPLNKM